MAQLPGGPGLTPARPRSDNDLYTVLAAIGLVCVVGAFGYALYKCYELLGVAFPGIGG